MKCGISLGWTETEWVTKFCLWYMSQKCCDDFKVHYKLAMGGAPQGAMRVASQIWQVVFSLQILQVFCRNPTLVKCGGEAQHLEKVRIWSPPGLPNVQSSTARPKTPCIEVFLVSLERS